MRPESSSGSVFSDQLGPQPAERQGILAGPRSGGDPMRPLAAAHLQRTRERDVSVCWGETRAHPLEPMKRRKIGEKTSGLLVGSTVRTHSKLDEESRWKIEEGSDGIE